MSCFTGARAKARFLMSAYSGLKAGAPTVRRKRQSEAQTSLTLNLFNPGLLFFLGLAGVSLGWRLRYRDTGQHLVERLLRRHFLLPAAILTILMLEIAGAAAHLQNLFTHHGYDGVVHGALTAGTMIVNDVAETHSKTEECITGGYCVGA